MEHRSSQSDINSQSSHGGVDANPKCCASQFPSAAAISPTYGHNSVSGSYDQQHIVTILSALGTLHLLVSDLRADQEAFRKESQSTIRSLCKQVKESEHTIAMLRIKVEQLESTIDISLPPPSSSSWKAKARINNRRKPCSQDDQHGQKEEEKCDNIDDDSTGQLQDETPEPIYSHGLETSTTQWLSESDSEIQLFGANKNVPQNSRLSVLSPGTPPPEVPVTSPLHEHNNNSGIARSVITDATSLMHSEERNMVETIESTAGDDLEPPPLPHQLSHRNSSMRCIGYYSESAAVMGPICYDNNAVQPQIDVPVEIEIKPSSSSLHDLRSEGSSSVGGAARLPNRRDAAASLISDISFCNNNNDNDNNSNRNSICSLDQRWTDEEMTRKLEELNHDIKEIRRVSLEDRKRLRGKMKYQEVKV